MDGALLKRLALGWVFTFIILTALARAQEPQCRAQRPLVIGHSFELDWWTRLRLKMSANLLDYRISYLDLRRGPTSEALAKVDAVLIPGGADIHPGLYSSPQLPEATRRELEEFRSFYQMSEEGRARDAFEFELVKAYLTHPATEKTPLLGICRGMQMMAVAQGVPLVVDLRAQLGLENRYNGFDEFRVQANDSIVAGMFPEGKGSGFKYHHQNPDVRFISAHAPDRLRLTATSWGGKVAEAIEYVTRPAIGVQFHPEKSFPTVKHRVFSWLLTEACRRSQQGDPQ